MSVQGKIYRCIRLLLLAIVITIVLYTEIDRSKFSSIILSPPNKSFERFQSFFRAQRPGWGKLYPAVWRNSAVIVVEDEVNVTLESDPVNHRLVNNVPIENCSPGKQSAQNEFAVAVHPKNPQILIAGANDYRVFDPDSHIIDAAGVFYRSENGGRSWSVGLLPGLVQGSEVAGRYQAAGDPSIAAGPPGVFWFGNLVFNREDDASAIAASKSINSGMTWNTSFVFETSAQEGDTVFNDKPWIAADPTRGQVAHMIWSQLRTVGEAFTVPLVYSSTTNGGSTWTLPRRIGTKQINSGVVGFVDRTHNLHLVWIAAEQQSSQPEIMYAVKNSGTNNFEEPNTLARIVTPPTPLSWGKFRAPTLPGFVLNQNNLHVVWQSWNGIDSDIVYIRSLDLGHSWSQPLTVAGGESDQFFPWVGAHGNNAFISYLDHFGESAQRYHASIVGSSDRGATWSVPAKLTSVSSDVRNGNKFRNARRECGPFFIGDYTGIVVGADGIAHPIWMDIRGKDQDPFTTRVRIR